MNNEQQFTRVTAEDSNDYFCPLDIAPSHGRLSLDQLDDCVEAEVVGRYIGNLNVVGKD